MAQHIGFGQRVKKTSKIKSYNSKISRVLSRAFNIFIKLATGIPQKDTQVGFNVGNGEIMHTIFSDITVKRNAFDGELYNIASIRHLRIRRMPVILKIDRRFKVEDIVNIFIDVTRIWYKRKVAYVYQSQILKEEYQKKC
jgi:hypothetical protein